MSAVRSVRLPATLKLIEEGAFKNCGNLESIELPQGLQGIGPKGFFGTGLVSVSFPPPLSMMPRTMDSPMPRPSPLVEKPRWNMRSAMEGWIIGPLLAMAKV